MSLLLTCRSLGKSFGARPLFRDISISFDDVERTARGSRLTLNYKVAGFANGGAAKLAPVVDGVLAGQLARYRKYAAGQRRF